MSATPKVAVSDVKAALVDRVGEAAVTTASEDLDAYTADTYWPALAAVAAGAPLARPEIVVRPETEEDVAAVVAVAAERGTPVATWGGGSGTQGGALPIHGGIVLDMRSLDRGDRGRRDLDDRDRPGRRQRPQARGGAQRPRLDAAALPGLGRVGHDRRLHRRARLWSALDALRQDRGPGAHPARGHAGYRADRHGGRAAPRRRAGADPGVRRLGGNARRDHSRHPAARAPATGAPVRDRLVPERRRRDPRDPARPPSSGTARRWCACTTRRRPG